MASIVPIKNKDGEIARYKIRVFKGYDVNGKQITPYSMSYTPPSSLKGKALQKELERVAKEFEEQCISVSAPKSFNTKLVDFIPTYLKIEKDLLAPTTFSYYTRIINTLIVPMLGHFKLKEIKPEHVQQYITQLLNLPKTYQSGKENTTGEKLSAASVKRYLTVLQSVLNRAVKLGLISESPAKAEKISVPKVQTPKTEIFTKQEAAEMLTCLQNEPLQFQALIQLAVYAGARRGELVGLKFSDVDFDTHIITIERAAYKLKDQPTRTKPPKDYETRTITVNESCCELLKSLKSEKEKRKQKLGAKWVDEDWIFTQSNGAIMNPTTPSEQFSAFLKKNNLRHRKFHSLRHTSATLLLYAGVDIRQVQNRLGHSDISTTNKYLQLIKSADAEAVDKLEKMLNTPSENFK